MATAAELAEKYIAEHPSVRDCLKAGVVNYSKLARGIVKETGGKASLDAILIACRRHAERLKCEKALEEKIISIVKKSELEIKNKVVVAIVGKRFYREHLYELERKVRKKADVFISIEGVKVFTIITLEKYLPEVREIFKHNIVKVSKDLAMITVKSPRDVESTPGVVSCLYSAFGEHGINIVETMSCWTDTIFIISEKDMPLALKYLKF